MDEGGLSPKAIGFYWTLPVPWAGFRQFSSGDAEAAALESYTIGVQRDSIHRWAKEHGYALVQEEVFLELSSDRGTDVMLKALQLLLEKAMRDGACILVTDFGQLIWRSHPPLTQFINRHREHFECVALSGDEERKLHDHFSSWRYRHQEWSEGKPARARQAQKRAAELRAAGSSYPAVAEQLNAEGIPSLTGRPWTGENLRKLLKAMT